MRFMARTCKSWGERGRATVNLRAYVSWNILKNNHNLLPRKMSESVIIATLPTLFNKVIGYLPKQFIFQRQRKYLLYELKIHFWSMWNISKLMYFRLYRFLLVNKGIRIPKLYMSSQHLTIWVSANIKLMNYELF